MKVTDIHIEMARDEGKVLAFARIVLDGEFVVRELKLIRGPTKLFVAMPDRKIHDHCPRCTRKNQLQAEWCNWCGKNLGGPRDPQSVNGRSKYHQDVAHPVGPELREEIEQAVIAAYERARNCPAA